MFTQLLEWLGVSLLAGLLKSAFIGNKMEERREAWD
jgi:hypothetical protein